MPPCVPGIDGGREAGGREAGGREAGGREAGGREAGRQGGGRQGGKEAGGREAGGVPGIGGSESIHSMPLPYIYASYATPRKSQKKIKKAKKVLYKASKL